MRNSMSKGLQLILLLFFITIQPMFLFAQMSNFYVDENGIIRDRSGQETMGFGVNYTVPFAHAYRSAQTLGVDIYEAIDQDVYHFSRLGFDLYRVHVWDTEISDSLGNLKENEHLKAFDYLLSVLSSYDINYILTPIAFWGNGWPEPDHETSGFSHKYGKDNCLTDPDAILAQENFLFQFMNHKNSITGYSYKHDPRLIGVEISNEPHHRGDSRDVQTFVEKMVKAVKRSGYDGPVFYNTSHGVHFMDAYFDAGIDGGTFQWYPTGLGYQKELPGNYLPNVDNYLMPFDSILNRRNAARIVYEFDAADIGRSYMYPAMARSFRKTGIQLATHFSYDPGYLAYANTEYNTHYMNLAYAPHKALALKISSAVFHKVELNADYGKYPSNVKFGDFRIDPEKDLALYNSDEKFFYTNSSEEQAKQEGSLKEIAGHGNSPHVKYDGTGAYFLDKMEAGIWRLEVMPDVMVINNLFGRNSLDKTVAVIQWNERKMKLSLTDLGPDFSIKKIDDHSNSIITSLNGTFGIRPGVYLLLKKGIKHVNNESYGWSKEVFHRFHAPDGTVDKTYLIPDPVTEIQANSPLKLKIRLISPDEIKKAELIIMQGWRSKSISMIKSQGFEYYADIPDEFIKPGFLNYYITVETTKENRTFPADKPGKPFDWNFYDRDPYEIAVLNNDQAITLFNSATDPDGLSYKFWPEKFRILPTDNEGEDEIQLEIEQLHKIDQENLNAIPINDYTISYFIEKDLGHLSEFLTAKKELIFKGRTLNDIESPVQIALVDKHGVAYGATILLNKELNEHRIPIADLMPVRTVIMPRPYPTFLPYFFDHDQLHDFQITSMQKIQISIGPGLNEKELKESHGIGIVSVKLK